MRKRQTGKLRTGAGGFTLVEMLAAVALLAILGYIVSYVFMSAQAVSSDSNALREAHQVARTIFKVMESDITGAWLRRDQATKPWLIPPNVGLVFYSDKNSELDNHIKNLLPLKTTTSYWDKEAGSQESLENYGLVLLTTVSPEGGENACQAKVMYLLKENGDLVRGLQVDEELDPGDPRFLDYEWAITPIEKQRGQADPDPREGEFIIGRGVTVVRFRFFTKYPDGGEWWDYWADDWKDGAGFRRYLPRAVEVRLRVRDRKGLIKSNEDVDGEPSLGVWFTQVMTIPAARDWP